MTKGPGGVGGNGNQGGTPYISATKDSNSNQQNSYLGHAKNTTEKTAPNEATSPCMATTPGIVPLRRKLAMQPGAKQGAARLKDPNEDIRDHDARNQSTAASQIPSSYGKSTGPGKRIDIDDDSLKLPSRRPRDTNQNPQDTGAFSQPNFRTEQSDLRSLSMIPAVDGIPFTSDYETDDTNSSFLAFDAMPLSVDEVSFREERALRREREASITSTTPLMPPVRKASVSLIGSQLSEVDDLSVGSDEITVRTSNVNRASFTLPADVAVGVPESLNESSDRGTSVSNQSEQDLAIERELDTYSFLHNQPERKRMFQQQVSNYLYVQRVTIGSPSFRTTLEQAVKGYLFERQIESLDLDLNEESVDRILYEILGDSKVDLEKLINDEVALKKIAIEKTIGKELEVVMNDSPLFEGQPAEKTDVKEKVLAKIQSLNIAKELVYNKRRVNTMLFSHLLEHRIKNIYSDLADPQDPEGMKPEGKRLIGDMINQYLDNQLLPYLLSYEPDLKQTLDGLRKGYAITDALETLPHGISDNQEKTDFSNQLKGLLNDYLFNEYLAGDSSNVRQFVGEQLLEREVEGLGLGLSFINKKRLVMQILQSSGQTPNQLLNDRAAFVEQVRVLNLKPRLESALLTVAVNYPNILAAEEVTAELDELIKNNDAQTIEAWVSQSDLQQLSKAMAEDRLKTIVGNRLSDRRMIDDPAEVTSHLLNETENRSAKSFLDEPRKIDAGIARYQLTQVISNQLTRQNIPPEQRALVINSLVEPNQTQGQADLLINNRGLLQGAITRQLEIVNKDKILADIRTLITDLGLHLTNTELHSVMMKVQTNRGGLNVLVQNRQSLMHFVRTKLPGYSGFELSPPRIAVRDGDELTTASKRFVRQPDVTRLRVNYLNTDGTQQRGIDAGGLRRQFWTNVFSQIEALPAFKRNEQTDHPNAGLLEIVARPPGLPNNPRAKDLKDIRRAGQAAGAALLTRKDHKLNFLQKFEPRIKKALNDLNLTDNGPGKARGFPANGIADKLFQDILDPIKGSTRIGTIDINRLSTRNELAARELISVIKQYAPGIDHNNLLSDTSPDGNPLRSVDKVERLAQDMKDLHLIEDTSEFVDYLKEELEPLFEFVRGVQDVYSPGSNRRVGDKFDQMTGGKTLIEYLNPTRSERQQETSDERNERESYIKVEITAGARVALGMSQFWFGADQTIAKQTENLINQYLREECDHVNEPNPTRAKEKEAKARKVLKFITGSESADPAKPIKVKIVAQTAVRVFNDFRDTLPRSHTCFNTIDIPVCMIRGINPSSRRNGVDYQTFKKAMDLAIDEQGFGIS